MEWEPIKGFEALEVRRSDTGVVVARFLDRRISEKDLVRQIGEEMEELLPLAESSEKLVIDFENLEFICSSMIQKTIDLKKAAISASIQFRLCNICPEILEVFEITRLSEFFTINPDLERALASFG